MARIPLLSRDAGSVARQVYDRMISRGMGQKALAVAAGLNETYVRDLLKGRSKNPKNQELLKLSAALGCDIADLNDEAGTGFDKIGGNLAYSPGEVALIDMWRILTPEGKSVVLSKIAEMIPHAGQKS